jgi:hypothetical protein
VGKKLRTLPEGALILGALSSPMSPFFKMSLLPAGRQGGSCFSTIFLWNNTSRPIYLKMREIPIFEK